jgi:hypothetical protein
MAAEGEGFYLALLPNSDLDRLTLHLKVTPLTLGEALYDSGIVLLRVYFPLNSIVSLIGIRHRPLNRRTLMGCLPM